MLSGNKFSGLIPKSVADIPVLFLPDLSRKRFSGDKFPGFNPLGLLYYVDLPSCVIYTLTGILALGENKFSVKLPKGLTNLTNLEYLDFLDNNITGNFPEYICQLSELQVLSLCNNSLIAHKHQPHSPTKVTSEYLISQVTILMEVSLQRWQI